MIIWGELSSSAVANELSLLLTPDSITDSSAGAEYEMLHFWDNLGLNDSVMSLNNDFLEQNFVNYISLLSYVDSSCKQMVVDNFLDKIDMDSTIYTKVYNLAGKYLSNSDSPMRNEEHYILFLNHALKKGKLGEADYERAVFRHKMAMKNRPGTIAPDFMLVTRENKECNFKQLLQKGENLVIFYNSDCRHCWEVLSYIASESVFQSFNIIAVDSEDNRDLWEKTNRMLPESWLIGYALDSIQDDEQYIFPEMPTIYLINGEGVILIKEVQLTNLINKLQ